MTQCETMTRPSGTQQRVILHADLNAFYASVAQHLDPNLRGKAIAVAGDPKKRNGIILAKSRPAKLAGVKTGAPIWQAKQTCPGLIVVPPDYAAYKRYSRLVRMIYYDYTNQVEPFGLDEAWLDITGSLPLVGTDGLQVAREISERVKTEVGLTISIGISWNKVFAKLGSDIDSGDGLVQITPENYRTLAWKLPASEMIYVGRATTHKLHAAGYETIGDLAGANEYFLKHRMGVVGLMLREFARGNDASPVREFDPDRVDVEYDIKGIGNGLTAPHDLTCEKDVRALVWLLTESVAQRLREAHLQCKTVSIGLRDAGDLSGCSRQITLREPTCLTHIIANTAMDLIHATQPLDKEHALRGVHVRTTGLVPIDDNEQRDLFGRVDARKKAEALEFAIDDLRRRFGNRCIRRVVEMTDETMEGLDIKRDNTVHPIGFLR